MTIVADLQQLQPVERRLWFYDQSERDRALVLARFRDELGTPWSFYQDDPVGFIEDVLGEYLWSMQRRIARSVQANRRTAVPAGHSSGKTWLAARLVAWFLSVYEPGSAKVVTTAPRWRHVRSQLWPQIVRLGKKHKLPGRRNQTEWLIDEEILGEGFAQNPNDEAAGQGYHAPHLLVIVDEAGGIFPLLGNNLNSLMTGDAHLLAIGNPPTEAEAGWFETICEQPIWNVLPIPAFATPNFTGEEIPESVAMQLVDDTWVRNTAEQFGEDSAYYIARVLALFPKVFARKVIPVAWCEDAMEEWTPPQSNWQRLGVDVASDGGDEMVVALADGFKLSVIDTWAGADSADQTINAERVLDHILRAEGRQKQLGFTDRKVRVKVDGIGIGSGTSDILSRMGKDGRHHSDVVKAVVSERATDTTKFINRRAEMWWAMRDAIRAGDVAIVRNEKLKAQLTGPTWKNTNTGLIAIEKKETMKKRGVPSPDEADALCLAIYEPEPVVESEVYDQMARSEQRLRLGHRRQ